MTEASPRQPELHLAFDLRFEDLYREDGLNRLDQHWCAFVHDLDPGLAERYKAARADPASLAPRTEASLLIEAGPLLDAFIATLFGIRSEHAALHAAHQALDPLFRVKWKFVRRQALLGVPPESLQGFDADAARTELMRALALPDATADTFDELALAQAILRWQSDAHTYGPELDRARHYCAWAAGTDAGRAWHAHSVLFHLPQAVDPLDRLPQAQRHDDRGVQILRVRPQALRRRLDGVRAPLR